MIHIEQLPSFPAGENPFWHEQFKMGTDRIASNVMVMMATHPHERASHIEIINKDTGERVRVWFGPGHNGHWNESHGHIENPPGLGKALDKAGIPHSGMGFKDALEKMAESLNKE